MHTPNCKNVGSILRYIHNLEIIKNDFVLIYGDLITNIQLKQYIKEHNKYKYHDKKTMMTVILTKIDEEINHSELFLSDDALSMISSNGKLNKILFYKDQITNK